MKCSEKLDSVWETTDEDNVQSMAGSVQIFSYKTQEVLKDRGVAFYPLHGTLLNFSKRVRRVQILSGATVLAYLTVAF